MFVYKNLNLLKQLTMQSGFTLIELSIVLVIIGLIIGGILVGQDLISAAAVRSQVAQIEKYQTAVNTFRGKYNDQLPGDISNPDANNFGFSARGTYPGQGDGNGIIQSAYYNGSNLDGATESQGETVVFWRDLSTAGLVDSTFNTALESAAGATVTLTSSPNLNAFLPQAKIGGGNYVYVWNVTFPNPINQSNSRPTSAVVGNNYFGLSIMTQDTAFGSGSTPGLTVAQAFAIDTKMDDGMPLTGHVLAAYMTGVGCSGSNEAYWAAGGGGNGCGAEPLYSPSCGGNFSNIPAAYTCFDGRGSSATPMSWPCNGGTDPIQYSIETNGGTGINCALSFQFQ